MIVSAQRWLKERAWKAEFGDIVARSNAKLDADCIRNDQE
jgi:hypothetical protein